METNIQIFKKVESRNKKTTDKNERVMNAMEAIFEISANMDTHVQAIGALHCILNPEKFPPSNLKLEATRNLIWKIAVMSSDTVEEAVGIIVCTKLELQEAFIKASEKPGGVEFNGFIKNQN